MKTYQPIQWSAAPSNSAPPGKGSAAVRQPAVGPLTGGPACVGPTCQGHHCRALNCSGSRSGVGVGWCGDENGSKGGAVSGTGNREDAFGSPQSEKDGPADAAAEAFYNSCARPICTAEDQQQITDKKGFIHPSSELSGCSSHSYCSCWTFRLCAMTTI